MTLAKCALILGAPLLAVWAFGIAASLLHIWQRHRERVAERRSGVSYNHGTNAGAA